MMIFSSERLAEVELHLDNGSMGDYIMKSMREQKKNNLLCDATIQCGEKNLPVHRSVLYAYSMYCRKLFAGSFPPKTKDGMILIDLNCFPENVVTVIINIMYGEKVEETGNIDVEEFMKLADFLQMDAEIKIITEILRQLVDDDNCLEMYKLACTYNFLTLQTLILSYLNQNMESVTNSPEWKRLDETILFSIIKHPIMHCSSSSLIGEGLKLYYTERIGSDVLTGIYIYTGIQSHGKTDICYHKKDDHKFASWRLPSNEPISQLYFIFCKELYCITESEHGINYLCRYSLHSKCFRPLRVRCKGISKLTIDRVLIEDGNETDFTVMYIPTQLYEDEKEFALVKLTIHSSTATKDVSYVNTTFNVRESAIVWNSRDRKILFFIEASLYIYDIDDHEFEENVKKFDATMEEGTIYAAFDGQIFALAHDGLTLKLHTLNKKTLSWKLYLQHEVRMECECIITCNSSTEMAIILESANDDVDHIYKLNVQTKTLALFKTTHEMCNYLYVPSYFHS